MAIDPLSIMDSFSTPAGQQTLAADPNTVANLDARVQKDPKGAAHEVAKQCEALFLEMLMRAMRSTSFDNEEQGNEMQLWRGLLDQQYAQAVSSTGKFGMTAMLEREINRLSNNTLDEKAPAADPSALHQRPARALKAYEAVSATPAATPSKEPLKPQQFVQTILPHARDAASQLGVTPDLVVAHAALESGWGKRAIRHPDGRDSHNLFGIKAGSGWQGATVDVLTTEYINGLPQKRTETFRAYGSYQEAFADYANFLAGARYRNVLNSGPDAENFARNLKQAGYATDPSYDKKFVSVWSSLDKA